MKTTIHTYSFDTRDENDKAAFAELEKKLKAQGLKCFETWGGGSHYFGIPNNKTVELETEHLFNNQWNTAPIEGDEKAPEGRRVHDWAQDYPVNFSAHVKRGHYLEQTPEMNEARRNRYACGYCGKQEPAQKGYDFCPHCIGSEYLEQKELYLLRMQSVASKKDRKPLTEAEAARLVPLYIEAQTTGHTEADKKRIKKEVDDLHDEYHKTTKNALTKRDGFLWLIGKGIKTDNVIYYDHTNVFSFGWRKPVSNEVRDMLLDIISDFPFAYEIKCEDGKKLEAA